MKNDANLNAAIDLIVTPVIAATRTDDSAALDAAWQECGQALNAITHTQLQNLCIGLIQRIADREPRRVRVPPETIAANAKARAKRKREKYRTQTQPAARRRGQEWTGAELELLDRAGRDLTYRQVADMTGRTWAAVNAMKYKLRQEIR